MKNYFFSNLSALNTDLNYAVDAANSLSGYATTDSLTAYATKQYVVDYVDQHAASGDYLPLSGGDLSGRIYLKESTVVPGESYCTFNYQETQDATYWYEDEEYTMTYALNLQLSVMNAGQEFIEMMNNGEGYTGEGTSYTVKVHGTLEITSGPSLNSPYTIDKTGTITFGNYYCDGSIDIGVSIQDDNFGIDDYLGNLIFDMGMGGSDPSIKAEFTNGGDEDNFDGEMCNIDWTAHTTSQTVTTTEPFALSSDVSCYVDTKIGAINTILDSVNGQII